MELSLVWRWIRFGGAWKNINELEVWKWLGGDFDLQKSMVRKIIMEEFEILRQRAEDRLLMWSQKKVELEVEREKSKRDRFSETRL